MTYFDSAIDHRRKETVTSARKFLRKRTKEFDAIAFTGMSGAALAPILAYLLDKQLIIVRKDRTAEASHSTATVEYIYPLKPRIVIVDDFVCEGLTIKRIIDKIKDVHYGAQFVAVYCYHYGYDKAKQESLDLPVCWPHYKGV